ncbi:NfeD family protein [Actimicrobium antarcticum]|uniref:NfeD family protein n=1 Tax=Actimicrobium antarcticum TaxID=1051899 RepID=A0ABP7TQH1_9BURK
MAQWMMWLAAAGTLVILEIFTGTFYLLMIAVGLSAGALAGYLGLSAPVQFVVAAVVGVIATVALSRSKLGKASRAHASRDPNASLDIGQSVTIDAWHTPTGGKPMARVMYRGAMWDVEYAGAGTPAAGVHHIIEIRGSCLLVLQAHPAPHTASDPQPMR